MPVPADRPHRIVSCTKPIIGLVGGIGAGKSLAAALFAERGARVIDADALGHEALRQPAIMKLVVDRWGPGILGADGQVNRREIAARVFADSAERRALEAIVFPWIDRRIREEMRAAETDPKIRLIVLDAAIMLETGWDQSCDFILFVDAPREQRMERLAERRGWNAAELANREQAQLSVADKRSRADSVLLNDGTPEDLARQVDQWFATSFLRL
jgi:dephospho-CoA kinase